ncbi:MAG: hypothetical protein ABJK39_01840 [Hyphomicrobiales bacterium]
MKPQVLITGFSVFPSAPVNPTEALIKWLMAQDLSHLAATFHFHLFKTSYAQVDSDLAMLSRQLNPDVVLHFGLDQNATSFQLESTGRNALHVDKPDVDGICPAACISAGAADEILSTFPTDEIEARLQGQGLAVQRSNDAGGYLCNYLLYQTLSKASWQVPPKQAGFIHVPHLAEHRSIVEGMKGAETLCFLERESLQSGCLAIVEVCLAGLAQE